MCEKEIQLIAIICLFDFVCGTQNLVSSFDFQEGHLDNPVRERERQRGDFKHLSVHQWIRFAIPDSQQPTSPIGFLFLKLPPPPCAVLLVIQVSRRKIDEFGSKF